jgi:hypothetical protein
LIFFDKITGEKLGKIISKGFLISCTINKYSNQLKETIGDIVLLLWGWGTCGGGSYSQAYSHSSQLPAQQIITESE